MNDLAMFTIFTLAGAITTLLAFFAILNWLGDESEDELEDE